MLCLPAGSFSIPTEISVSCTPAHLLQETTMLIAALICVPSGAASLVSQVLLHCGPPFVSTYCPCFGSSFNRARGWIQPVTILTSGNFACLGNPKPYQGLDRLLS